VPLQWRRATLRDVKSRPGDVRDRLVDLVPRAVAALEAARILALQADGGYAGPPSGPVFRRADGRPWHPDVRVAGRQLNDAFARAAAEAGIGRRVTLHVMRHSWATWHHCVHRDLKRLQADGAWESVEMANRYTHLAPSGMAPEVRAFWGLQEA